MATAKKKSETAQTVPYSLENNVRDYDIDDMGLKDAPFTPDYGSNLFPVHPDTKEKLKSYVSLEKDGYREMILEITSLLGSIGAVHYYAKLIDYNIRFTRIEDKENKSSTGGYGTKGIPDKYRDFKIELSRPVTQRDLDNDEDWGRESYMRSKIGDLTRGFWTEEDAVEAGVAMFKLLFKGKWKLRIRYYSDKKDKTIYLNK